MTAFVIGCFLVSAFPSVLFFYETVSRHDGSCLSLNGCRPTALKIDGTREDHYLRASDGAECHLTSSGPCHLRACRYSAVRLRSMDITEGPLTLKREGLGAETDAQALSGVLLLFFYCAAMSIKGVKYIIDSQESLCV